MSRLLAELREHFKTRKFHAPAVGVALLPADFIEDTLMLAKELLAAELAAIVALNAKNAQATADNAVALAAATSRADTNGKRADDLQAALDQANADKTTLQGQLDAIQPAVEALAPALGLDAATGQPPVAAVV